MTIKIFDLEQDQSLLVELGEKDVNKVCGGAVAADAAIAEASKNANQSVKFQQEAADIQDDAHFVMTADQLLQSSVKQIKA